MLVERIYHYFDDKRVKKEAERQARDSKDFNIAPSYLTGCARAIYYNKTGEPATNPTSTHSYIKFELGNMTHEMVQGLFQNIGAWEEGEDLKEINWNGFRWLYRIDGKLIFDGVPYLMEIKSAYANGWNDIEKAPREDHVLQLYCYLEFEKVERGIILYIGRDNGRLKEYHFSLDALREKYAEKMEEYLENMAGLKKSYEEKRAPDRTFNIAMKYYNGEIKYMFQKDKVRHYQWRCDPKYCQWSDLCWKEEKEQIKKHTFFIDNQFID